MAAGAPLGSYADEANLFADLARAMRDASICGLGQTASSAIESAFRSGLVQFDPAFTAGSRGIEEAGR
jgi:NADH-quinone oxidoreductase subunit F